MDLSRGLESYCSRAALPVALAQVPDEGHDQRDREADERRDDDRARNARHAQSSPS